MIEVLTKNLAKKSYNYSPKYNFDPKRLLAHNALGDHLVTAAQTYQAASVKPVSSYIYFQFTISKSLARVSLLQIALVSTIGSDAKLDL